MHIRRGPLPLNLVGFPPNQNRKHISPGKHCVHLHLTPIQTAPPACFCPLQFEPVIFAIDGDVVHHKRSASLVSSARLSLLPSSNPTRRFRDRFSFQDSETRFHCRRWARRVPGLQIAPRQWLQLPHLHLAFREALTSAIDPNTQCPVFLPENPHQSECGG